MAFAAFVIFWTALGILMGLGAVMFYQTTGRFMIAMGSLASVCGYVAMITANTGFSFVAMVALSLLVGGGLGGAITWLARRISVSEFLLLALALVEIVKRLDFHLDSLTGGAYGLRLVNDLGIGFLPSLFVPGLIAAVILYASKRWLESPNGLTWRIVGGARPAAILMGVNPVRPELAAGCFMGAVAAIAGVAHVVGVRYIHPDDFGLNLGIAALAVGVSARPRTLIRDTVVLCLVLFSMREILRLIDIGGSRRFAVHEVVVGLALILAATRLARVKA